ncbi:MAG: hypothetical protein IPJ40_12060 [Saprospirales bacterium]|nr:hypothetical protein [Saprospirales bacterium]
MTTQFTSAAFRASALVFSFAYFLPPGQDIFKITDNSLPDEKPVVSGQYVAWEDTTETMRSIKGTTWRWA